MTEWTDDEELEMDDAETAGGGILAIVLLIVAILLLVFLFRDELGLGTPTAEIAIPERITIEEPADVETAPTDALDAPEYRLTRLTLPPGLPHGRAERLLWRLT